jgi:predicted  nucleic acid-binding Zn-ribbon protein
LPSFYLDSPDRTSLNLEKLIEKLSSDEIDPEYVSSISQFAEQVKQREAKSAEMVSKLQREIIAKNREVESLHDQLYDAQTNIGKIQSLEQALKEEKERHNMYIASVNPKLAENYQVSRLKLIYFYLIFSASRTNSKAGKHTR